MTLDSAYLDNDGLNPVNAAQVDSDIVIVIVIVIVIFRFDRYHSPHRNNEITLVW